MATITATAKNGKTVEIKNSKHAYTHAWFVTADNGARVVYNGFSTGAEAAKKAGARQANFYKDAGEMINGKFVMYKNIGFEIAETTIA